ncbi:MAG: hypothetical protein ISS77_05320 [Phycisphaerae bacterium]|nr:hypothetical protein [Phycisphaerae bacterium]
MTGEVQEKKKPGIIKRILKWTGLFFLGLILIVAVAFQAPWKVTTILLILFLACTILPKPARKWFWLGCAGVIVILIIWVFLPINNEGWRPYTFDDQIAAMEAKYAVPDEENAAVFYNYLLEQEKKYEKYPPPEKAVELTENEDTAIPIKDFNDWRASFDFSYSTFFPEFWDDELDKLTLEQYWSSKDYPKVAKWLQSHDDTIKTLFEASNKEKCYFSKFNDSFVEIFYMEYFGSIKCWVNLFVRASNNDIADGHIDDGIEKLFAVLKISEHIYRQPTLVDLLLAIAIEDLAVEQTKRFVIEADPTEEHFSRLQKKIVDIERDWKSDLLRILEFEKLLCVSSFCQCAYQKNAKGRIRFSRDPMGVAREQYPEEFSLPSYWQRRVIKLGNLLHWFYFPSNPKQLDEIIDKFYTRFYLVAEPEYDWSKKSEELFSLTSLKLNYSYFLELHSKGLLKGFYEIHDMYLRGIAEQRGTQIIIALRRFKDKNGKWPQNLAEIKNGCEPEIFVDPMNGGSFVYKLTEENFTLYSKGKNNIDDNGENKSYADGTGADDWQIWPIKK